jgi:uncharacterized protein
MEAALPAQDRAPGFYPGRAPIEAYGNGGFRFAGMSHRGSILCLPSGVMAWDVADTAALDIGCFGDVLVEGSSVGLVLLGTGRSQVFPPLAVRRRFLDLRIGLDPMDTGAACRTYNVLLEEWRPVAAALIAVD